MPAGVEGAAALETTGAVEGAGAMVVADGWGCWAGEAATGACCGGC